MGIVKMYTWSCHLFLFKPSSVLPPSQDNCSLACLIFTMLSVSVQLLAPVNTYPNLMLLAPPHSKLPSLFHLQELLLAPPLLPNPSAYGYWFLGEVTYTPLLPHSHLVMFQVIIPQGLVSFTCSGLSEHLILNLHCEPHKGRYSVCFLAFYFQDLT